MASTLITGLGLVGTSFAQHAIKRGDTVVFYDVATAQGFFGAQARRR
jgi:3-hydroxyisobutyrate dehydrogenase-like beta-hydroxyacid dehydrogenase